MTRKATRHYPAARHHLPFERWPAQDRQMWEAFVLPAPTVLDEAGPGAWLRPRTQRKKQQSYSAWLNHITLRHPALLITAPVMRVTPETVATWVQAMRLLLSPYTRLLRLVDLMTIVKGLDPSRDWRWLQAAVRRLDHEATPAKSKAGRVRPAAELFVLGETLMREADNPHPGRGVDRRARYRDGLMIAFLALRVLRLRNLMGLELGRTLIQVSPDRHRIVYGPDETKTGATIEVKWPEELEPALARYLAEHRPRLLRGRTSSMLWIGVFGDAMAEQTIRQAITLHTQARLGVAINPHLFRDCAVTTMAVEDPAHIGLASSLLGHASTATTDRHYRQANSIVASRQLAAAVAAKRASLRPAKLLRRPPARPLPSLPLFSEESDR
jgi:integrase